MPSIASHLATVTELDSELSTLQSALGTLRTSYLSALQSATADPTAFQQAGMAMRAKTDEIKAMVERIQRFFDHHRLNMAPIEMSWYSGERYTP